MLMLRTGTTASAGCGWLRVEVLQDQAGRLWPLPPGHGAGRRPVNRRLHCSEGRVHVIARILASGPVTVRALPLKS
jgi:hypothetical protein